MDGAAKLDELRGRLAGLSRLLGGEDDVPSSPALTAHCPVFRAPPAGASAASPTGSASKKSHVTSSSDRPAFKAVVPPSKSILRASTNQLPSGAGPAFARLKEEEAKWAAQKGELQMLLNKEKKRRLQLESELKRAQEMHQYRLGEVKHLKAALKQRDDQIVELKDQVRELELSNTADKVAQEAVEQAQAERDQLKEAMQEMLQKLALTNEIMAYTDMTISDMEAKVHAMDQERQQALQQAADAAHEAASLRETASQLHWKCDMLQQLADMTLQQNEEKMRTLKALLNSEESLDTGLHGEENDNGLFGGADVAGFGDLPPNSENTTSSLSGNSSSTASGSSSPLDPCDPRYTYH
ncbi:hypothetical protein N2152v2_007711 [Parachlorella kessleri]